MMTKTKKLRAVRQGEGWQIKQGPDLLYMAFVDRVHKILHGLCHVSPNNTASTFPSSSVLNLNAIHKELFPMDVGTAQARPTRHLSVQWSERSLGLALSLPRSWLPKVGLLVAFPPALAEEDGGRGVAVGDGLDVHGSYYARQAKSVNYMGTFP
jgi:hypothetical protein